MSTALDDRAKIFGRDGERFLLFDGVRLEFDHLNTE